MSNIPTDPVAFETLSSGGSDIQRYVSILSMGYNAHGASRMETYTVTELNHCKEVTVVGHEYISAKVVCPDSSSFFIIFERFRGPDEENLSSPSTEERPMTEIPAEKQPFARTVWKASTEAIQTSHDASCPWDKTRDANDSVSMSTTPIKPAKGEVESVILQTIIFKKPIPLYKVAVLAGTIHRRQDKYRVTGNSCFFYALAIFCVMHQFYKNDVDKIINWESSIKAGKVPAFSNTPMRDTFSIKAVDTAAIINSYQGELRDFEVKARSKDNELAEKESRAKRESERANREAKRRAEETERADRKEAENAILRQKLAMFMSQKDCCTVSII